MTRLDELVTSLLYEGYALYPYTPGATKNATPTPFGIIYPPGYAAGAESSFDHLRLECRLIKVGALTGEVRFLQPSGEGHRAIERRIELDGVEEVAFSFDGLSGRARLRIDGSLVRLCVHNLTEVAAGLGKAGALAASLISTQVVVHAAGGRFLSPLEAGCESVNTYPVLATTEADAVLGAAIVLPDHPQIAAASRGSLFDATEIEEALLLHVKTLTPAERTAIAAGDPKVAEMIERAASATPEEILRLHGLMRPADELVPGETETDVGGVTVRRGSKLVLCPKPGADAQDFLLDGRVATLERIYIDYDGEVHLAVTIDSDPMQEVLRESGRLLFFKPDEVEVNA